MSDIMDDNTSNQLMNIFDSTASNLETMTTEIEEKTEETPSKKEETPSKKEETPSKKEEKKTQKKTKNKKEAAARNMDPARFAGDGLTFKAKLIGIDDVDEARGDLLCQRTMQKLKAGVKSQGPHKQRILMRISLSGLKILDEKSGNVEHEHAVHRISFISRDMGDARAFGYIYGGQEGTHKFFAIKTEKSAESVVLSLRDLFSVVYELKKKEMEEAKAKQGEEHTYENMDGVIGASGAEGSAEHIYEVPKSNEPVVKVACLLDLETELESIQQGIMQMDAFSDPFVLLDSSARSVPSDPTDPFGSTTSWKPATPDPFVVKVSPSSQLVTINPPSAATPQNTPPTGAPPPASPSADLNTTAENPFNDDPFFVSSTPASKQYHNDKYSALQELSVININSTYMESNSTFLDSTSAVSSTFLDSNNAMNQAFAASIFDAPLTPMTDAQTETKSESKIEIDDNDPFRDICPLGKKKEAKKPRDMFADMNPAPPKKTLKQMIEETNPVKFESEDDPFTVAPSPVRKLSHQPAPRATTFQANFTPDPTNPFNDSETVPLAKEQTTPIQAPAKPVRLQEVRSGAVSPPSPDMPPPPLPNDIAAQQAPAPPPRPRPHANKPVAANLSLIQPPVSSPTKKPNPPIVRRPSKENQTIKLNVDDPFASDPFFTQPFGEENNNKSIAPRAIDPFAMFDDVDPSPFIFNKPGREDEDAVYATVTKPKRAA